MEKTPVGKGVALKEFTGYELRGHLIEGGTLVGEVFALGMTQRLGENWKLAESIGKFSLNRIVGNETNP